MKPRMGQALMKPVWELVSLHLPKHYSGVRTVTAAIGIVPEWIWIKWWDLVEGFFSGSESISLTQICREICRFICLWIKGRKEADTRESYIAKIRYDDR